MNVTLEIREIEMLIKAISVIRNEHRCVFCEPAWEPIIDKLNDVQEQQKITAVRTMPSRRSKPWSDAEDAIIRKYSIGLPQPVWSSMQAELPDRTINMLKGRYSRMGIDKLPAPPMLASGEVITDPLDVVTGSPILIGPVKTPPPEPDPASITPGTDPNSLTPTSSAMREDNDWSWAGRPPPLDKLMGGR